MDARTSPEFWLAIGAYALLAITILSFTFVAIVALRRPNTPPIQTDESPDVIPFELRRRT